MSRHRSRRVAATALALAAVAGLSAAAASQLGLTGGTVQSGVATFADCQPAAQQITVSLTSAYVPASNAYATTGVSFGNVAPACQGLAFRVQLLGASGAVLDTNGTAAAGTDVTGTVALTGGAFTVPVSSTATASIVSVALVLAG